MVTFFWDNDDLKYEFNPNKRYLIYYRGCCCPPHKGHLQAITDVIQNNPNFVIVIDQIGSESRHGVPYRINRKIWKQFIKFALPNYKVYLENGSFWQTLSWKYHFRHIDEVIFLRGEENTKSRHKIKQSFYNKHHDKLQYFKHHHIDVTCYRAARTESVSATKFVYALIHESFDVQDSFLPSQLPLDVRAKIIRKLKQFRLRVGSKL